MTGEYRKTNEIAKAEIERDERGERLGINSKEYKAREREIMNHTSERKGI